MTSPGVNSRALRSERIGDETLKFPVIKMLRFSCGKLVKVTKDAGVKVTNPTEAYKIREQLLPNARKIRDENQQQP